MSIKTKRQALDSIHPRTKIVAGKNFSSYVCYVGTDPVQHKKIMFERATKADVEKDIDEFYNAYGRGASPAIARELTSVDYAELTLVRSMLREAGLENTPLVSIVADYIKHAAAITRKKLGDAYDEYLSRYSDLQVHQRRNVADRVGSFVRAIGADRFVDDIDPREVSAYAETRLGRLAPKTFKNHVDYVKSFFNWCCRKDVGYRLDNPAETIRPKPIAYKEPEFVDAKTVRSVFDLIESIDDNEEGKRVAFAYFAIAFFSGIRAEEIFRLRRCDVNLEEKWIRVAMPKGFQHGIAPRIVPLCDTALAWLRRAGLPTDGSKLPFVRHYSRPAAVFRLLKRRQPGWSLPHNACRHSFVTMHVALCGDPRKTEAMCGTSSQMRRRNYMGLATKRQAEEYFGVMPA